MFSICLYAACFSIAIFVANSIGVRPWALHPALPVHMCNSSVMTRFGDALLLQQPYQQSLGTLCVATDLYDFVENVALLVDGAPPDARHPFKKAFFVQPSHICWDSRLNGNRKWAMICGEKRWFLSHARLLKSSFFQKWAEIGPFLLFILPV